MGIPKSGGKKAAPGRECVSAVRHHSHVLIVELSVAAPEDRPPFDTSEVTDSVEDAGVEAAVVEETDDDVNRSPDSILWRGV